MSVAPASPQFKQHPLVLGGGIALLSGNSVLVDDVAPVPADDTLVIPPPPAYVDGNGGKVVRLLTISTFLGRVKASVALLAADKIQLIYKAEGGREIVLGSQNGPLAAGATFSVFCADIIMSPTDLGVFLRVTQAVPTGLPRISGTIFFANMRGPVLSASEDVTAVQAIVVGADGDPSLAQLVYTNDTDSDVDLALNAFLLNFDPITAHTYQAFISDGTTTIEISNTAVPPSVAAGAIGNVVAPSIPPGWSLYLSLGQAVVTFAPRFMLVQNTTNLDVARNDQGGAF